MGEAGAMIVRCLFHGCIHAYFQGVYDNMVDQAVNHFRTLEEALSGCCIFRSFMMMQKGIKNEYHYYDTYRYVTNRYGMIDTNGGTHKSNFNNQPTAFCFLVFKMISTVSNRLSFPTGISM